MATAARTFRSASPPSEPSRGMTSTGTLTPDGLSPAVRSQAGNTPDGRCPTKERIQSPGAESTTDVEEGRARRRDTDQLIFHETKGDVLFACIVPVILGFLGLALIFVISRHGGKTEAAGELCKNGNCLPDRKFLICRMRSKDLWEDVVSPAAQLCTHLVLTLWGDDFDERDRSQQAFFKYALNRTRLYLTVQPEECPRTSLTDLSTRFMSLHLDGFEFYMKGNESADDVKACFNLIDRFVSWKGPSAAILRSGPYGTLVKPNVLANVYQLHTPVNNSGQIPNAIFVNNLNYTDSSHAAVRTVRINELLIRAQKERATSITEGAPNTTNICYSLSFMGIRMDTRTVVKYSEVCETVQCCLVDKSHQRDDRSRSLVATVINPFRYNVSYDDADTLAEKVNAVTSLTRGALCIAAEDVQADDFAGKCSGHKAPLLTKVAELARWHNSAFVAATSGSGGKTVVAGSADVVPLPKPEFPIEIFL
ncbi:uncharacterized protein [Dermacentor albipictus]|uniref:uncharacterized protein isoform X2 n=1 Tax=Dermacentor albipictus TaxID=60249 RepID=UPI0038FCDB6E